MKVKVIMKFIVDLPVNEFADISVPKMTIKESDKFIIDELRKNITKYIDSCEIIEVD